MSRVPMIVRRAAVLAFGAGLTLALGSSGTIVLERLLGNGSPRFVFASSVLVAGVSSLVFSLMLRLHSGLFVVDGTVAPLRAAVLMAPQLVGAACGIVLTHLALQRFATAHWLSESPRQFVNDAVAAIVIVAAMRACGRRTLGFTALAFGAATLALYSLTASFWHVDRPPRPFDIGVQQLVLSQAVSAVAALFATRAAAHFGRSEGGEA